LDKGIEFWEFLYDFLERRREKKEFRCNNCSYLFKEDVLLYPCDKHAILLTTKGKNWRKKIIKERKPKPFHCFYCSKFVLPPYGKPRHACPKCGKIA